MTPGNRPGPRPAVPSARRPFAALLAACALSAPAASTGEPGSVAEAIRHEIQSVFENTRRAIVKIEAVDPMGRLSGTGFFIDPGGNLLTAYSIGGETSEIEVLFAGQRLPARRVFADRRGGIALLKVDAETPFVAAGSSETLPLSAPVMLVGYPMDLPLSPALGVLAGRDVKHGDRCFSTAHLRAHLPVQRGQGGAPLLDLEGRAIGIVISSLDDSTGCFALPIEAAEKIRRDFIRFGASRPGWIGVKVGVAENPGHGSSARIDGFVEFSPAAEAGLAEGDILLRVGGHPVSSPEDVLSAAFYITSGDPVEIEVLRGGERLALPVVAASHPHLGLATAAAEPPKEGLILLREEHPAESP